MNNRFLQLLQMFFLLLDLFALNIALLVAPGFYEENITSAAGAKYSQSWLVLNGIWLLPTLLGGVYDTRIITYFIPFMRKTARFFLIWSCLVLLFLYVPPITVLSKGQVILALLLFFILLVFNRFIYLLIRQWVKQTVSLKRKIVIVGYNPVAIKLASHLEIEGLNLSIVGIIDDKKELNDKPKYPVFQNIEDTLKISKQLRANEVYSTIMPENNYKVYNLMQQADKELIRFRIVPDFSFFVNRPMHIDYMNDMPILSPRREPLEDVINKFWKRSFDILISGGVTIFILSWMIPLLGLLLKLESRGSILFVQIRSGKNNKPFRCLKFRSMMDNKEANSIQATRNDKRVTKIGRILRKTSLDEFPQFINVLKGEMSIVGPRPHMIKHTKKFSELADDYMIRQFLKPGITGWAQVNGYRGEITELAHIKKRVEHDLWYIENWSFWLDLKIMFLTVYNVFKGEKNAY